MGFLFTLPLIESGSQAINLINWAPLGPSSAAFRSLLCLFAAQLLHSLLLTPHLGPAQHAAPPHAPGGAGGFMPSQKTEINKNETYRNNPQALSNNLQSFPSCSLLPKLRCQCQSHPLTPTSCSPQGSGKAAAEKEPRHPHRASSQTALEEPKGHFCL